MLTFRVGYGGTAGARAMARYLEQETLAPERGATALYYSGETPALTFTEELGRQVHEGDIGYGEALDMLILAALKAGGPGPDVEATEERLGTELADAATRADFGEAAQETGGTVGELRQDLSPAMAARLGIADIRRPLTVDGVTNLLSGLRLDGGEIAGRTRRSAGLSIGDVFGLPMREKDGPVVPPSGAALDNILAGLRADGGRPRMDGKDLSDAVIAGARKRFLAVFDAPTDRPLTAEEKHAIGQGKVARGTITLSAHRWQTQVAARRERVTYVDLTFSADKSLSIAWALAPTEAERAVILGIHREAVTQTLHYAEELLGHARRGDGGKAGTERGEVAWMQFHHYTSRPTVETERVDAAGNAYTDFNTVPLKQADMQVHTHAILLNTILTESGHVGSIDLDRLQGVVKQLGAVYQAYVADGARQHGIEVAHDERTGAARLQAVPSRIIDLYSKRTVEAEDAARRYARDRGLDWDALSGEQQSALMKAGASDLRQAKDKRNAGEERSDFANWRDQARDMGYEHRSVLRPDEIPPPLSPEQRLALSFRETAKLLAAAFDKAATLSLDEAQELAARSLITAGISNPGADIRSALKEVQERGIVQDGAQTPIVVAREEAVRGKLRWSVTTGLVEQQETRLVGLVQEAARDRSADLAPRQIDRAVHDFLARRPDIDGDGEQWQAQRRMIDGLAAGGRTALGIGVAGSGKSTVLQPLVQAWKDDGRQVFGAALAWRQTADLKDAGITSLRAGGIEQAAAMDAFLKRAERGTYALDRNSVVVVDEVGLLGTKQLLRMTELQQRHGLQLVMLGDPEQCAAIEAGPVIRLMERALGKEAIPRILTSIRQRTDRERETTALWCEGKAAEALERKLLDGDLKLVPGSRAAVVEMAAGEWLERRGTALLTPTNADAHELGVAIRDKRRQAGELGDDVLIIHTRDPNAGTDRDLPVAIGEHLRLYTRVSDAANWRHILGSNGDQVEVVAADSDGLRIRNLHTGEQGRATWKALTPMSSDRPALAYGYASTIIASQGRTVDNAIVVLPGGSRQADARSIYTALSRHQNRVTLIVSDAAERRQIFRRGDRHSFDPVPREAVLANIASNLSRRSPKTSALELLSGATAVHRGSNRQVAHAMEPGERIRTIGMTVHRQIDRLRLEMSHGVEQVREMAVALQAQVRQQLRQRYGRGPSLGR